MTTDTQDTPIGRGVIRLSSTLVEHIYPKLFDIAHTTVQGELQAQGVFDELRTLLLLPEDYRIIAIYVQPYQAWWLLWVESPSIPVLSEGSLLSLVNPVYQRNEDGTNSLLEIKIEEM